MSGALHAAVQPQHLAVICGSSSGIGLALAKRYAAAGMHVAMGDINAERLQRAAKDVEAARKDEATQKILPATVDVADETSVNAFRDKVLGAFQSTPLTVLHANAGVGGATTATSQEGWSRIFNTNFFGVVNVCTSFVPEMQRQFASGNLLPSSARGLVVCTGSKQGITKPPGSGPAYNASKAAVLAYTENLAHELRQDSSSTSRIDVRLLVPGWVWTALTGAETAGKTKPDGAWTAEQTVDFFHTRITQRPQGFYVVCPDNETTEEQDRARQEWSLGDIVQDRPALSRWHPEYKDQFDAFMKSKGL